jgi:hypothetical protein
VSPPSHLSELALQEWSRYGATRLYREDDEALAHHLQGCAECRRRVEDYRALDLSVNPYGEPGPTAPFLYRHRLAVAIVLLLTAAAVLLRATGIL